MEAALHLLLKLGGHGGHQPALHVLDFGPQVSFGSTPLGRDDKETHGSQDAGRQDARDVGGCRAESDGQQGAQTDGPYLQQGRPGHGRLHRFGYVSGLDLLVIAGYHLLSSPPHRIQQRLPLILERLDGSSDDHVVAGGDEKRDLEKQIGKMSSQLLTENLDDIVKNTQTINGIEVILQKMSARSMEQLKELGDKVRALCKNTVALFSSETEGKLVFVCAVTDDLIQKKNLKAGDLVRQVAQTAGGSGGGRPHLATAGAKDIDKHDQALNKFLEIIRNE